MRTGPIRALSMALLLGTLAATAAGAVRPITETDLLKFQWVTDPQISPDGREVAYVLVQVNEKEDRYDTSLWSVATSGSGAPKRLTAGPRDSSPRWSPDGRTVAFVRAAGEKDKPQIFLLPMSGGEARKLTDLPKGASARRRGRRTAARLLFTSSTNDEDLAEKKSAAGKTPAGPREEGAGREEQAADRDAGDLPLQQPGLAGSRAPLARVDGPRDRGNRTGRAEAAHQRPLRRG